MKDNDQNVEFLLITGVGKFTKVSIFSDLNNLEDEDDYGIYRSSLYPYNHVFESESGHITEIDDSPGGERILKDLIKNGTPEEVASAKEDIIKLYGEWIEYFPQRRNKSIIGDVISKKAQALLDFKIGTLKEVYDTFDMAYQKDPTSFTNPKLLYNYFKTYFDRYKAGDQEVTMELLFEQYEEVSEKFDIESTALAKKLDIILKKEESGTALSSKETRNKRVYNINSNAIGTYLRNLDAIIVKEATCENLIPLYQKNFDANKDDVVWLKRAVSRMDSKECSDDPLFVTLVEAFHSPHGIL